MVSIGIVLYASLALTELSDTAAALVDKNAMRVEFVLQAESSFNSAAVSEKNVILSAADWDLLDRSNGTKVRRSNRQRRSRIRTPPDEHQRWHAVPDCNANLRRQMPGRKMRFSK